MWFEAPSPDGFSEWPNAHVVDMIEVAQEVVAKGFDRSLGLQQSAAIANVERLRRVHPEWSPEELRTHLERTYLASVSIVGLAAGAASPSRPQIGVPMAVADMLAFTEASILYVLSVAEIYGLHAEDLERRRLLVMTVLLGNAASRAINQAVGRIGPHWARQVIRVIPMSTINEINAVLGYRFVTKYGTNQGVLVLSKQLPRLIGAVLGGTGNHLVGRGIVKSARRIFGDIPNDWPDARRLGLQATE